MVATKELFAQLVFNCAVETGTVHLCLYSIKELSKYNVNRMKMRVLLSLYGIRCIIVEIADQVEIAQ